VFCFWIEASSGDLEKYSLKIRNAVAIFRRIFFMALEYVTELAGGTLFLHFLIQSETFIFFD
jgi:hypothetical protein